MPLTHEVVLEDLTDAAGVAQQHLALLAIERLAAFLLERSTP